MPYLTQFHEEIMGYLSTYWERISNKQKWPRSWLWPSSLSVLNEQEIDWKKQHDEVSSTIRRVMLTIIAYSAFCLLTLSTPDSELITKKINLPIAGVQINIINFLIIGPLVLIRLLIYSSAAGSLRAGPSCRDVW